MSIKEAIESWAFDPRIVRSFGDQIVVTTTCLYPSMSAVTVMVEGGQETMVIHDNGNAIIEASGAGARFQNAGHYLKPIAKKYGVVIARSGQIRTSQISVDAVGAGIVMVANASKEAADILLSKFRPLAVQRDTKEIVRDILHRRFAEPRIHKDRYVTGASTKPHKFDYAVDMENGEQLLLDIVVPDASSINSAVVASLDVGQRPDIAGKAIQRIVIDDTLSWRSQDISLLSVAGRPVQLSRLPETVDKLAEYGLHHH